MKKSLIAAAVASVCAAPMAAQAEVDLSAGFLAGIQQDNDDASNNDDSQINAVLDTAEIIAEASEDLGNGLTAEAGVGLDAAGGTVARDHAFGALSGDFGSVLLGWNVDSAFYMHAVAPTDVGEVLGGSLAYYYASDAAGAAAADLASGIPGMDADEVADAMSTDFLSNDEATSALQYGYDGGAFQLTAEAVMDDSGDDNTGDEGNEAIDRLGIGASFDAGPVMIGVAHESTSRAGDDIPEPSKTGFSVSSNAGGVDLSGSYVMFDLDVDDVDNDPTALDLAASMDFGGGLSGLAGVGIFDADNDDDAGNMTGFHVQVMQDLSSRTNVFAQLQTQSIDGGDGGEDVDPQSLFVGVGHSF